MPLYPINEMPNSLSLSLKKFWFVNVVSPTMKKKNTSFCKVTDNVSTWLFTVYFYTCDFFKVLVTIVMLQLTTTEYFYM